MAPKSVTIDRGIKSVTRGVPGPPGDLTQPFTSVTFDTVNPDLPLTIAQFTWDGEDDTMQFRQNGTILQIGQEGQWPVINKSGADIPNGTPVMAVGTTGATGRLHIVPMDATNTANVKLFGGLTSEDIDDTDKGKVTAFGKVRNIQTNGANYGEVWADKDIIYLSPTIVGALTNIEPSAGQVKVPFAFVINSHVSDGVLSVRVTPIDEGLFPSQDEKAALAAANAPSASNPIATIADIGGGGGGAVWEPVETATVTTTVQEIFFDSLDFTTYEYKLEGYFNITSNLFNIAWYAIEANAAAVVVSNYRQNSFRFSTSAQDAQASVNKFVTGFTLAGEVECILQSAIFAASPRDTISMRSEASSFKSNTSGRSYLHVCDSNSLTGTATHIGIYMDATDDFLAGTSLTLSRRTL